MAKIKTMGKAPTKAGNNKVVSSSNSLRGKASGGKGGGNLASKTSVKAAKKL